MSDLRQAEYDNSAYGHGYIDWHHSSSFAIAVRQLIDAHVNDVLARGDYESALALGFEGYLFLTQVDVDGSDGFVDNMLDVLDGAWDTIYEAACDRSDDALLRLLFDRLNAYSTDPAVQEQAYSDSMGYDVYDYQCGHIEKYLVERFSTIPAYAPAIQVLADERLALATVHLNARRESDERMGRPFCGSDFYMRDAVRWVLVRLQCMETTKASYGERLAFATKYLTEEAVCLHFVDERERAGDHAEALRLLEARVAEAHEKDKPAPDWALARSIALNERAGNTAPVRSQLEELVVCGSYRGDAVDWFRKLRGMCDEDEWAKLRETLFGRIGVDRFRWRYYVEEGLFDRLMDEVEPKGVRGLGEFEPHLAPRYPERVLALYKTDLLGADGNDPPVGSTRKSYASFASRVRHVRSIAGGDELASA